MAGRVSDAVSRYVLDGSDEDIKRLLMISELLADHARDTPGIPGFGRLQTPKKLPCVTQATGPFTRIP